MDTEAKLKQQSSLYEAVRSDRNIYSKNLAETQQECQFFKKQYKIVNHQISQLKEEIDQKEVQLFIQAAILKEHEEHSKKDNQIQEQQKISDKYQEFLKQKDAEITDRVQSLSQTKKIKELHQIIKESEQYRQKLQEEYDLVVAERDILGTQLIRRNQEAQILYEKIKINQSYLSKGEAQYQDRLNEIESKKNKIAQIMCEIKDHKVTS